MFQEFILTLVVIFVLFRIFGNNNTKNNFTQNNNFNSHQREGKVTVDYKPEEKKIKHPPKDGDYIDYEEIK